MARRMGEKIYKETWVVIPMIRLIQRRLIIPQGDTGTFTKTINSTNTRNRKLFQARYNNGAYTIKLTNVKLVKV